MKLLGNILIILQILSAVIAIILVLLQADKDSGNIVTGGSERASGAGMSQEARLSRLTIYFGIAFIVFTIASSALMLINYK